MQAERSAGKDITRLVLSLVRCSGYALSGSSGMDTLTILFDEPICEWDELSLPASV